VCKAEAVGINITPLMGIENYSPMLGHDLSNENLTNRAMMLYANNFAYMNDNGVTILQPDKEAKLFNYVFSQKSLVASDRNDELSDIALAHALWRSRAFKNDWYRFSINVQVNSLDDEFAISD
jgi:phosphoglycerol transferase MdoB-like AlkP superfamily enzyme|tara:strand:+ start:73 stop:441 length:369 start_codon:yes stop_codon:yes gene_type:complete